MRRMISHIILGSLAIVILAALFGCQSEGRRGDRAFVVPVGKLDDYRSTHAMEFVFKAQVEFSVPSADKLDEKTIAEVAKALANNKMNGVVRQVDRLLRDHWSEAARTQEGVAVTVRSETTQQSLLQIAEARYRCSIEGEVAGPMDLLQTMPLEREQGARWLEIELGDEVVKVDFQALERTPDAYPQYDQLYRDGLDIALFIGGDYNEARYDRKWASDAFAGLVAQGFTAPAASVMEMTLNDAPFRKRIRVEGQEVEVRVRLIHAEMGRFGPMRRLVAHGSAGDGNGPDGGVAKDGATEAPVSFPEPKRGEKWPSETPDYEALSYSMDVFEELVKSSDVVVVQGHSGLEAAFSGVAMYYNPRIALSASEFRELALPEKYQIFVFSGCETYAMYADQLYLHPLKNTANLDVITAVNYTTVSHGVTRVLALIDGMMKTNEQGDFVSASWDKLLEPLNVGVKTSRHQWLELFGVHGLADNPTLSPFADPATVGQQCNASSDCPGSENLCIDRSLVKKPSICGAACVHSRDCPNETTCIWVAIGLGSQDVTLSQQCAPQNLWL